MEFIIEPINEHNMESNFYGSKALNLGILSKFNFKVPKTWVISCEYACNLLKEYDFEYENGGFNIKEAKKIYTFFNTEFPSEIYKKIYYTVESFVNDNNFFSYAIRSSHSFEDGSNTSFAGLFRTELNVKYVGSIVNSILRCWSDCFTNGIINYTELMDKKVLKPCSIILQEFVPTTIGGVLFKSNNNFIVNANWGLAKSIVDGDYGTEEWIFNKKTCELNLTRNNKDISIIPIHSRSNPKKDENISCIYLPDKPNLKVKRFNNTDNLIEVELNNYLVNKLCLNDNQLYRLFDLTEKAANVLHLENYDVEWGISSKGYIYILQIRPLTKTISIENNSNNNKIEKLQSLGLVGGIAKGKTYWVENEKQATQFPSGGILVAKRLVGSVLHAAQKASGCILESRSPLSHSAIIARELGIPVVGATNLYDIKIGHCYLINGDNGEIEELIDSDIEFEPISEEKTESENSQSNIEDLRPILSIIKLFDINLSGINEEIKFINENSEKYIYDGYEDLGKEIYEREAWLILKNKLPDSIANQISNI